MKYKSITEMVKQHLQDRGLENLATEESLKYYINHAKQDDPDINSYLLALNVVDMIIHNEPAIIARHYGEAEEDQEAEQAA